MDIRSLKYYIAVVQCGNISAAAERLHMTQPPLSQQMAKLESELGVQLFVRGARNIALTEPGKMLYDRALSLVEFVEQTAIEVGSFNFEGRGTISLGCISSCANMLLSFVKNDFSKKYPNTMIKVSEKNTYELIKLLSANLIEGAIMRTPFDIDSAYKKVTILRDQIVAIGSRKIFETCKNEITIDELVDYPLITYRRWEALFTDIFRKMNYVPNYYCINDDARTSLEWAMANLGIALVPQSITAHLTGDEEIIIKPIQEDTLKTEVCFVWNAETYTSAPMKCFIESLFHYYCIIEETLDQ